MSSLDDRGWMYILPGVRHERNYIGTLINACYIIVLTLNTIIFYDIGQEADAKK